MHKLNIGMAGQARLVTTNTDNIITQDTGFNPNLILDSGLNALGVDGQCWFDALVIGTGNTPPSVEQTNLDGFIAKTVTKTKSDAKYGYDDTLPYHEVYVEYHYDFANIAVDSDVIIKEFGLMTDDDTLATRTLTKDVDGDVKEFVIKQGDSLSIFYGVSHRFSTDDLVSQINVKNNQGDSEPYDVIARPAGCGSSNYMHYVGKALAVITNASHTSIEPIKGVNKTPKRKQSIGGAVLADYIPNSYQRTITLQSGYAQSNADKGIRSIMVYTAMGFWQIQFDSVADGSPINKTSNDKLLIPITFSWGRI